MKRTIKRNEKGKIEIIDEGDVEEYIAFDEYCDEGDPYE